MEKRNQSRILVLDGEQRSALAATRSLGGKDISVIVASSFETAIAGRSRFADRFYRLPDINHSPEDALERIAQICDLEDIGVVFPMTDASTMLLHRKDWPNVAVAAPPKSAYEAVSDKANLLAIARRLGIPTPQTIVTQGKIELFAAIKQFHGPVVLKPARSRYFHEGRIKTTSVVVEQSVEEAIEKVLRAGWLEDIPCLVQEFIPGHGAGLFSLYSDRGSVADFAHRRLREKPPRGGVSVLSESVTLNPEIRNLSHALLKEVHWRGPAMIEFKITDSGNPYLMEINGRFWGSLQLAIDSGIDFPWLLYQISIGALTDPVPEYRIPQKLRWLLGDFDSLLLMLRNRKEPNRKKLAAICSFLNIFQKHTRFEVCRRSDMKPFYQEVRNWFGALGSENDRD